MDASTFDRFIAKVDRTSTPDGCHPWTGAIHPRGYGRFALRKGKTVQAHRLMYEHVFGPIPEGLGVLHKCDVRHCQNPEHLYVGTAYENSRDMVVRDRCNSPLTIADIKIIRANYERGNTFLNDDLADTFGVTNRTIRDIGERRTWNHVD